MSQKTLLRKRRKVLLDAFGLLQNRGWHRDEKDGLVQVSPKGKRTGVRRVELSEDGDDLELQIRAVYFSRRSIRDRVDAMVVRLAQDRALFVRQGYTFEARYWSASKKRREGFGVVLHVDLDGAEDAFPEDLIPLIESGMEMVSWISEELAICNDRVNVP